MSDDPKPADTCAAAIQSLQSRKVELNHQLDVLEFQRAALTARLEEVEDLLEMMQRPEPAKRGRPKGSTKPPMHIVGSIAKPVPPDAGHASPSGDAPAPVPEGVAK